jgi:hypothetical protein
VPRLPRLLLRRNEGSEGYCHRSSLSAVLRFCLAIVLAAGPCSCTQTVISAGNAPYCLVSM